MYRSGDLGPLFSRRGISNISDGSTIRSRSAASGSSSGEIEAALKRHPAIRESVVVAREERAAPSANSDNLKSKIQNPKFDSQLVAYVTAKGWWRRRRCVSCAVSCVRLCRTPDHPGRSSSRSTRLPLTANGKIDRRRLPAPDIQYLPNRPAPRSPRALKSRSWWRRFGATFLNPRPPRCARQFFRAWRPMLLAARDRLAYCGRISAPTWPCDTRFQPPTVALLAAEIDRLRGNRRGVNIPPIVAAPRDHRIPLSFAQRRLWFLQ